MFKWTELFPVAPSRLTIVGMAKNTGKTVAMNYVQRMLHSAGRLLGLLSVGLDGERFDALTKLAKPAVVVQAGTIVATAEKVIGNRQSWDFLRDTGIETPVGRIIILRARQLTPAVLAGPSKNDQVQSVVRELKALGAEVVIIDGAFDRQSATDPQVSEQVILASGATLSPDMDRLIFLTKCRVEQLTLPVCAPECLQLAGRDAARVMLVRNEQSEAVVVPTTLLTQQQWQHILKPDCDAVILRGAVGDGLGEALLKMAKPPVVVVQDGGKIFINAGMWQRMRLKDVRFQVEQAIHLLGVTVNPVIPGGIGLDPDELLAGMGKALYPLPVIDIMREMKYRQ